MSIVTPEAAEKAAKTAARLMYLESGARRKFQSLSEEGDDAQLREFVLEKLNHDFYTLPILLAIADEQCLSKRYYVKNGLQVLKSEISCGRFNVFNLVLETIAMLVIQELRQKPVQ